MNPVHCTNYLQRNYWILGDAQKYYFHLKTIKAMVHRYRFEIVVAITGSSPSTGKISQARSSYINREIFWGQRFINIVSYDYEKQYYKIHDELFDCMEEVNTPLCSPKDYNDLQATHLQQEDDIKLTEPPPESEVYYYNDMSYHTNPYELHDIAERDPETDEIDESQVFTY